MSKNLKNSNLYLFIHRSTHIQVKLPKIGVLANAVCGVIEHDTKMEVWPSVSPLRRNLFFHQRKAETVFEELTYCYARLMQHLALIVLLLIEFVILSVFM